MSNPRYADERELLGDLLAGWTDCPIEWPNADFEPPAPLSNAGTPATWISVEIDENAAELADMAGGQQISASVVLKIYQQRRTGDAAIRAIADALAAIFDTADPEGLQFLAPTLGAGERDDDWYGRDLRVPFIRFT